MEVQITSRRGTVGSAFRRAAETRARGLEKYEPRLRRIEILFGVRRVDHRTPPLAETGSEAE
ncbi:MAG TPA: hypothetical protein VMM83_07350 [Longimicrobiales bacterium]|nr:hypothetical protein [Longimicrobiales bacterium]